MFQVSISRRFAEEKWSGTRSKSRFVSKRRVEFLQAEIQRREERTDWEIFPLPLDPAYLPVVGRDFLCP